MIFISILKLITFPVYYGIYYGGYYGIVYYKPVIKTIAFLNLIKTLINIRSAYDILTLITLV